MKRLFSLLFFLCIIPNYANNQVIDSLKRVDWSICGYPNSVPEPVSYVNVKNFGALGNGLADDHIAIMNAISSFGGNRGLVFFPSGDYLISSVLDLPDSIVLRGVHPDSSRLLFNMNSNALSCINISKAQSGFYVALSSGYFKGSDKIIAADVSQFNKGDHADIREENGAWDTNPAAWAEFAVGQIVQIKNISGDTLFLVNPLRIDYDSSLNPQIKKLELKREVGIESLYLERVDDPGTGNVYNIGFHNAGQCWVHGIESNKSVGSHVMIDASTQIEVTGSYFHHAFVYDGSGTRGYGITLNRHSGECLIENNIFRHLRHAMMVKLGANGNVVAYNYSIEPYRSELIHDYSGDISLHGHYAYSNLFEGNIVQNIFIDHYWGPSGPFNTLFRNRAELYGIIMTSSTVTTSMQNFVGNEVTGTGLFMGQFILTGSGHFSFGNNVKGTITPSGTNNLADTSYFLDHAPGYWCSSPNWPSVGIPMSINSGTIFAKERYQNGNYTYTLLKITISETDTIDPDSSLILDPVISGGTPPYSYLWSPLTGLSDPGIANPVADPDSTTVYTLVVTDSRGCSVNAQKTIVVKPETFILSGNIHYDNLVQSPLGNIMVYLFDSNNIVLDSTISDPGGYFSFEVNDNSEYFLEFHTTKATGGINTTDALGAMLHFVQSITLTGLPLIAADVDSSGYINATDALMIAQHFVSIINKFPAGEWIFEDANYYISGSDFHITIKALCFGDVDRSYIPPASKE